MGKKSNKNIMQNRKLGFARKFFELSHLIRKNPNIRRTFPELLCYSKNLLFFDLSFRMLIHSQALDNLTRGHELLKARCSNDLFFKYDKKIKASNSVVPRPLQI